MARKRGKQVVKFNFYRVMPEWRRLPDAERDAAKEQFAAIVEETASNMRIRSYSLVGLRPDVDLMLWSVGRSLEDHQQMAQLRNHPSLAP